MSVTLFRMMIATHILAGSVAALSLWVPVMGQPLMKAARRRHGA